MQMAWAQQKIDNILFEFSGNYRPDTCFRINNGILQNFLKPNQKTVAEIKSFLSHINIPKLSEDSAKLCEENLTKKDLQDSLKCIHNNRSPGNNGLTNNFLKYFGRNWRKFLDFKKSYRFCVRN